MDRSVDSIGSCSLDVDADSTDFSDTSGELNFLTPISGKDITREFTAGIKERCMLPVINCQAVTSVLDPVTGHISTVLTTTATSQHSTCASTQPLLGGVGGGGDTSPTAPATNKKPSYLNLACCVNGYSNLTTYDSKLRQDINKSREVSPSRPIIATLHYNRTTDSGAGNLLTAPTLSYVSMNNTINNNYSSALGGGGGGGGGGTNRMFKLNGTAGGPNAINGSSGGRMRSMNAGSVPSSMMGGGGAVADVTDNAAANGFFNGNGSFLGSAGLTTMRSKVISSQSQISSLTRDDPNATQLLTTPKKSFIQQRVEKLYGATEGVVINKQYYSSSERKYLNNIANENHTTTNGSGKGGQSMANGNGTTGGGGTVVVGSGAKNGVGNGLLHHHHHHHNHHNHAYSSNDWGSLITATVDENNRQINGEDQEGTADAEIDALPVLRHLRPEFRAQLQIFSPKKVPKASPNRTASNANGNNALSHTVNGTEDSSISMAPQSILSANGNRHVIEREEQQMCEERTHSSNGGGVTTNRSTTSSSRVTSHAYTNGTTLSSSGRSNGHHAEDVLITEASSITRHHSNTSTRNVTEQPTGGSYSGTADVPEESVEEKMRSLVVVAPSAEACVSNERTVPISEAEVTGANGPVEAAIADVSKPPPAATVASVIENGEQNGGGAIVDSSNGLEIVVHCDSSSTVTTEEQQQQQQAVPKNSVLRTANGGETTMIVGVPSTAASTSLHPVVMADIERQCQVETEVANRRAKSTVEISAPASLIHETTVVTNGTTGSSVTSKSSSGSSQNNNNNNNHVLDGNYFLQILKTERHRLETMADVVENEISQLKGDGVDIGEDLNGYVLVAVGKARLLCSQKMKQFEDLCYTNLNQSPDEKFQTTGEDLRGFWDMVMLQVNNVDATFVEIDSFRKNGWRKPIPKSPPQTRNAGGAPRTTKLVKRPYKTQTNGGAGSTVTDGSNPGSAVEAKKASAALAAAKREAQRKQLMEMKRKQKLANSQPQAVEIFAPSVEEGTAVSLNGDSGTQRTPAVDTS